VGLAAFSITIASRADFDFWWHLSAGRFIATRHALPIPDEFSFTAAGRGWISHEWLAELTMYVVHDEFGILGSFALFAACAAGSALLTIKTLRHIGTPLVPAAGWTLAMVIAMQPYLGPRPQVAAFLLMAAVVWLLERWITRRDRSVWLLPPLFCLWGNLHGSFAVGLAVLLLLLAGDTIAAAIGWKEASRIGKRERRILALVLAASVAAVTVNPNGIALIAYPFTKLRNPMLEYLTEWKGTDISDPRWWGFAFLSFGYWGLVAVRRPRLPAADLTTSGAFLFAALWCARFVPFAALAVVPLIGRVLTIPSESGILPSVPYLAGETSPSAHSRANADLPLPHPILNLLTLVVVACVLGVAARPYDPGVDGRLPVRAVDALGWRGLPGPLFHDYNWGGYLIWRLWPGVKVFIDGRGDDLYSDGGELLKYSDVALVRANVDSVLKKYEIRTVLYRKDTPLVRYLLGCGHWLITYDDGEVVRLEHAR
jgi:hypothetical protein